MDKREQPVSRVAIEDLERVDENEDDEDEPDEGPGGGVDVLRSDSSEREPHRVTESAEEERRDLSKPKNETLISCSYSSTSEREIKRAHLHVLSMIKDRPNVQLEDEAVVDSRVDVSGEVQSEKHGEDDWEEGCSVDLKECRPSWKQATSLGLEAYKRRKEGDDQSESRKPAREFSSIKTTTHSAQCYVSKLEELFQQITRS